MSRLDNKSFNQAVNMLLTEQLSAVAPSVTSDTFDSSQYDAGYTIIVTTRNIGGGTDFAVEVLTSDEPTSGFVALTANELIGGAFPGFDNFFSASEGKVAISRGILSGKRYVRARIFDITGGAGTHVSVVLNGAIEVSPPIQAEGTVINVT